jgi:hypothetical protein
MKRGMKEQEEEGRKATYELRFKAAGRAVSGSRRRTELGRRETKGKNVLLARLAIGSRNR